MVGGGGGHRGHPLPPPRGHQARAAGRPPRPAPPAGCRATGNDQAIGELGGGRLQLSWPAA
eukprot:272324-Lingulodinium_polyedra.AAC.1